MTDIIAQHWADKTVDQLLATQGAGPFLIASGISPSGKIHVGNLREVVTADIVSRVLRERGIATKLIFIADDYDPLRKVYPFLDPAVYEKYIGVPLSEVPSPSGEPGSYAEHFIRPFAASLGALKIEVEIRRASQMYASGALAEQIVLAMNHRDTIAEILNRVTGKEIAPEWSPFMPQCEECGSMFHARLLSWNPSSKEITYACDRCAIERSCPIVGRGKLTWRVDWPARWAALRVTIEPFGKDHGGKGGSFDTGKEISEKVFSWPAPFPVIYEWIRLKGMGDMSSSKGNVVSVDEMLDVMPPDVLRYFITRPAPKTSLSLDPTLQVLTLVDEVDDESKKQRDTRSVQLSQAGGFTPVGIPFNHIVNVWQVAQRDMATVKAILTRTGYTWSSDDALATRCAYAEKWLNRFAPEEYKFTVQQTVPEAAKQLTAAERAALGALAETFAKDPGMNAEAIHRALYEAATAAGMDMGSLCKAFYRALIGKESGPRAGWFAGIVGLEFVARRLREVAGS